MSEKKLKIDLVPDGCWYSNLRSVLPKEAWDILRKMVYKRADGKCDICGYQLPIEAPETTTPGASEPSDSETTGAPSTDGNSDKTDNADKNNGALLWIILGVVVVISAGAAITVVILKKKRAKKVDD